MKEIVRIKSRFIYYNDNTFGLDSLHDALNGGRPEIIGILLHRQAIHTDNFWVTADDFISNMVLTGAVRLNDSGNQILRYIVIVG